MKRKGISLIVLIVTIIVIIILSAVVILTLSKNNPIESAKEARFKEDVRIFQDELALSVSKDYTSKAGNRDKKFTAVKFDKIKEYIPSFSAKYERKFVIKNDMLVYNDDKLNEKELEYVSSLNINKNNKSGAEIVEDNPQNMYGTKVNYTAPNGVNGWKIFYSDGSNVYIITSEYIDLGKLPEKDGAKPDQVDATNYPKAVKFDNIFSKYRGSDDITDEKMKAFNSDYFKERINEETGEKYVFSSTYNNMKAVAYMLDKDIWSDFANLSVAEYAVGGASVEMTLKSYSQKNNKDYRAKASSSKGYTLSNSGETNWSTYIHKMLSPSDLLYVLPASNTGSGADGMWLASSSDYAHNNVGVVHVSYNGYVGYGWNDGNIPFGFRPLVCLNSDISLTWNEENEIYEIN